MNSEINNKFFNKFKSIQKLGDIFFSNRISIYLIIITFKYN